MTKPKSNNFGSNCSILSAIAFIIGGISFFNLPEIQMSGIRSGNSDQLSSYFNSVALEPTFLQIQMWSFVFVGILGLAILIFYLFSLITKLALDYIKNKKNRYENIVVLIPLLMLFNPFQITGSFFSTYSGFFYFMVIGVCGNYIKNNTAN